MFPQITFPIILILKLILLGSSEPFISVVMLCLLRYDLRARLLALCHMSHLMLCIAPFLLLRPKKRRASHIASRPVPRVFTLLVLAKLLCYAFAPQLAYIFPPCAASVILSLVLRLNVHLYIITQCFSTSGSYIQTKKQHTNNNSV